MCTAMGATMGLQAVTGVSNYMAARGAAQLQEDRQNRATKSLVAATLKQEAQLQSNTNLAREELERERWFATREARRIRASSIVQQAEAGAAGKSSERQVAALLRQEDLKNTAINSRSISLVAKGEAEINQLHFQSINQQNQINQPIAKPSALTAALGIGAQAANTYMQFNAAQAAAAGGVASPDAAATSQLKLNTGV